MFHRIVILFFILILTSLAIAAQETGELDPNANACNEGGSMAGKCNVDFDGNGVIDEYEIAWAWTCGWYMARYDAGIFAEVPSFCQSLLPSEPVVEDNGEVDEGSGGKDYCSYDLDAMNRESRDGVHFDAGFDVFVRNLDGTAGDFLYWSETDDGYPPCLLL